MSNPHRLEKKILAPRTFGRKGCSKKDAGLLEGMKQGRQGRQGGKDELTSSRLWIQVPSGLAKEGRKERKEGRKERKEGKEGRKGRKGTKERKEGKEGRKRVPKGPARQWMQVPSGLVKGRKRVPKGPARQWMQVPYSLGKEGRKGRKDRKGLARQRSPVDASSVRFRKVRRIVFRKG